MQADEVMKAGMHGLELHMQGVSANTGYADELPLAQPKPEEEKLHTATGKLCQEDHREPEL